MRVQITGGKILTPHEILNDHTLVIDGDKISAIEAKPGGQADQTIDATGLWVVPGMIDVHVHGGDGHDTMDATMEAIHGMARFFATHGVTSYYPTTTSAPREAIIAAIENVAHCPQPENGAHHLGVHIEGPYLNPVYPGAQSATALRLPDPEEYGRWLDSGVVRLITAAPEIEGAAALIEVGLARGIEFAAGHTGASYEEMLEAADHGLRQTTHTFNAMLGLHHRNPGTLGAALTDDRIYAQLIGDGIHVHPAMVKLLVRAKGPNRTLLITDSIRAAGLPDGQYGLGDQPVTVKDGIARTTGGALAGSTTTLDKVLRNTVRFAGLTLPEVMPMATAAPAEAMHLTGRKGVLKPGADADIILLDMDANVCMTMVGGRVVYQQ